MDCCKHKKSAKKCMRKSDKKRFSLPRRFTRKICQRVAKGFTMKASCAPYKGCKKVGRGKSLKNSRSKKNKTKNGQRGAGITQSRNIIDEAILDERSFLHDFLTEGDSWRAKFIKDEKYTFDEVLIWFAVESQFAAEKCKQKGDIQGRIYHINNEIIARRILNDKGVIIDKNTKLYHPVMGNEHLLDPESQKYKDYYEMLLKAQEGVKEYYERDKMRNEEDNSYKYPIEIQIQKDQQTPPRKTPPRGHISKVYNNTPTTTRLEEGTLKGPFNKKISPIKFPPMDSEEIQNKKRLPYPSMGVQEV